MRTLFTLSLITGALLASPAHASPIIAQGSHGEKISVPSRTIKAGSEITVTGSRFDESVGIYLAFCVIPQQGKVPTPCGGGVNKSGIGDASYWISSNPPPYGKGLAIPYQPGGRFTQKLLISRSIGKFDCRKVKCAVTVRADHLMSEDRSYDIFIPITVK